MKKSFLWWLISIFAVSTACSAEPDTFKIGVLVPLTGESAASYGAQVRDGILLAQDELGSSKIRLIFEDSQCLRQAALTGAKKLVDFDQVEMIIGDVCWTDLIAQVTEPKHVVVISTGSAQSAVRDAGDFIFRIKLDVDVDSRALAKPLLEQVHVRTVALIYAQDNWGEGIANSFKDEFERLGGKVIASEAMLQDTTDFRPALLRIKKKQPDLIMISGYPPQIGLIAKQSRAIGFQGKLAAYGAPVGDEAIRLGGSSLDGLLLMAEFDQNSTVPSIKEFVNEFTKKYARKPGLFAAMGFDAYNLFTKAIEKCTSNSQCVRDYFYSLRNYAGASGVLSFDDHGDVLKPLKSKYVHNGNFVEFGQKE